MNNFLIIVSVIVILLVVIMYIIKQIQLSRELSLKDTTLDGLEEKLKKHKLIYTSEVKSDIIALDTLLKNDALKLDK